MLVSSLIINCRYFVAQMCTLEDTLAHDLGTSCIDDVMAFWRPEMSPIYVARELLAL